LFLETLSNIINTAPKNANIASVTNFPGPVVVSPINIGKNSADNAYPTSTAP
jgi:hypothetical protein